MKTEVETEKIQELGKYDMLQIELNMNLKQAKKHITKRIQETEFHIEILEKLLPVLEDLDGKDITKRIETKLRKELGHDDSYYNKKGFWVCLDCRFGMFHITVDNKEKPELRAFNGLIGYASNPTIQIERLKDTNGFLACYHADYGRLKKYNAALKEVAKWIRKKDRIVKQSQELKNEMDKFGLEFMFTK